MSESESKPDQSKANRAAARGIVFLTVFIDLLGFGMVLPLLPIYAEQFTVDHGGWVIGLLMASFSAMQFFFAPLWGRLSDRIGRRPVLMIGLLGSVIFYALFGVGTIMQSLTLLFISRIGAGLAGATISTAQAYIADTTTLEERPKGMALIGMAFGLGFTFGPLFGWMAVPTGTGEPGPMPGFAAAALSAVALLLAYFKLPESRSADSPSAVKQKFSIEGLRTALSVPSIAMLLTALFVVIFSFAAFETTLSLLLKGFGEGPHPFQFSFQSVCLTYAYIGFTLALVQGGFVRRVAGKISEGILASAGCVLMVIGMLLILKATQDASVGLLYGALALVVAGFGMMMPSINSFISRRSDPAKQGGILGMGQSVNSLARIIGSAVGIPLLKVDILAPFAFAAVIMFVGLLLVILASRSGKDFEASEAGEA